MLFRSDIKVATLDVQALHSGVSGCLFADLGVTVLKLFYRAVHT